MADADSENKRRGAIQFIGITTAPVPDGTVAAEDRQQATWIYSGITAGAPEVGVWIPVGLMMGVYRMKKIE